MSKRETVDEPFCQRCGKASVHAQQTVRDDGSEFYRCACGAYYTVKDGALIQPVGDCVSRRKLNKKEA